MPKRNTKGEGSVYKDEKSNKWIAQLRWTDKKGEKHKKTFKRKRKTEAQAALNDFKKKTELQQLKIGNNPLFCEYSKKWLFTILINTLADSSFVRKRQTFEYQVAPFIGDIPIEDITYSDVQNMINELNKQDFSYSTIIKAYQFVNGAFRQYRVETHSTINPCEGIVLPKNKKKDISDIKYFTNEQRQLIKKESLRKYQNGKSVYRMGCLIVILMYSGMRVGELLGLKWNDVDFENKTVIVDRIASQISIDNTGQVHYSQTIKDRTKTDSGRRTIPMTKEAIDCLKIAKKITGNYEYVCVTKNGNLITASNLSRNLHSIQLKTGIAKTEDECLGLHALRHTYASMLFQNGCSIKVVSEILGHADTKVTENTYIHLIDEQKMKAIEDIDKFCD